MMKTQSTFSLTCTLLTLLCALTSLPLNSWSKTGEQENWFLAKEVPLPTGFSPQQYWSDGTNEALLGWSGNKIHKLDFSSKALTFSSSPTILNVDFIGDPNLSSNGFTNLTTKPNGDLLILAGIGQFYLGKWNGPGSPNPGTFSYFTISEPASPTVKINGDEIPGVLIGGSQITANQSKIAILLGTDMTQYTGENITGIEGDYLIKIFEGNYSDYMGITQQNYFWLKNGNLPEQINGTINNIALNDENQLVVLTTGLAQYFTLQGQFIKKVTISPLDIGRVDYSSQNSQFLINSQKSPPGAYVYDKQGNFVQFLEDLKGANLGMWTQDGHIMGITSSKLQLWKRAYRTKGLSLLPSAFLAPPNATDLWQSLDAAVPTTPPSAAQRRQSGARQRRAPSTWQAGIIYRVGALVIHNGNTYIALKDTPSPNAIPQPVVRSVAQRAGTNILDIDFEILDSDDATATAGIIASVDGNFDDLTKLIIPSSLAEGTENKIGQPVATNQTHRVSWYVKGDWSELTGNLKIGLLARDARRNKAVDLHFLELPFSGGKLTISRSPLKDSDISNFLLFELGRGSTSLSIQYGKIKDANGNTLAEQSGTSIISTQAGRDYFMNALGYRWATIGEVAMAKEAATPGTINEFAATNQVKPRNLPSKVNEYGFDVGNHGTRAWWVVKKNEVETLKFSVDHSFKQDLDMNQSNSFYGRALAFSENHHIIIGQGGGNVIPRYFHSQPSTFLNDLSGIIPTDGLSSGFGVSGTIGIGDSEISKAIAIDGDILAVGSSGENAVYLFKLSGPNGERFEQKARITPSSNEQGQYFGLTVALDGNILVVGAPFNNANGYGASGCAYVFRINEDFTYSQLAKLSNPAGEENDQFGYALTVSDGIIAIGANDYQHMAYHGDHGVFLYKVEGDKVRQTQLITPPGGNYVGLDHFGNSMAIENNLLFVGSVWGQAVSIFTLNADGTAQFLKNIKTPNPTEEGLFGISIAAHNDMLVIGASGEYSESSIRDGVAYVYRVLPDGRATLLDRLSHPESQQLSGFGAAVSITSSGVLVGAPGFDLSETKPNVGSAVLFRFNK